MQLSGGQQYTWILVILVGSLLEAAYMFSWFKQATHAMPNEVPVHPELSALLSATGSVIVLVVCGYLAASIAGAASLWLFVLPCTGGLLYALDRLPGRMTSTLMLTAVLTVGTWMIGDLNGLNQLFAALLLTGGLVVASAGLYRRDTRPGYNPLMAVMLTSIAALLKPLPHFCSPCHG